MFTSVLPEKRFSQSLARAPITLSLGALRRTGGEPPDPVLNL